MASHWIPRAATPTDAGKSRGVACGDRIEYSNDCGTAVGDSNLRNTGHSIQALPPAGLADYRTLMVVRVNDSLRSEADL